VAVVLIINLVLLKLLLFYAIEEPLDLVVEVFIINGIRTVSTSSIEVIIILRANASI
jgi:hypothetical protein